MWNAGCLKNKSFCYIIQSGPRSKVLPHIALKPSSLPGRHKSHSTFSGETKSIINYGRKKNILMSSFMDIPSSPLCVCEWCAGPVMRIKSSLTSVVELGAPKSPASCLAEICARAFLVKRHPRPLNCRLHIHCHIMAHWGKKRKSERQSEKKKKKQKKKKRTQHMRKFTAIPRNHWKRTALCTMIVSLVLIERPIGQNVWLSCFVSNGQVVDLLMICPLG